MFTQKLNRSLIGCTSKGLFCSRNTSLCHISGIQLHIHDDDCIRESISCRNPGVRANHAHMFIVNLESRLQWYLEKLA